MTEPDETNPLEQFERASGYPIHNPQNIPDDAIPKHLRSTPPISEEIRTVVYFMPDGDALIRYVKPSEAATSHSFHARSAFLILAVIPSINGGAPSVQFLKSKIDLNGFMKAAVKAYMATPENEIEMAQQVLGLSREHVEALVDRANAPEKRKLIPVKVSPEVDAQLEEGRWATIELKGERRDPSGEDCGECDGCLKTYVSDDPSTHCINCTCIMCIPGG